MVFPIFHAFSSSKQYLLGIQPGLGGGELEPRFKSPLVSFWKVTGMAPLRLVEFTGTKEVWIRGKTVYYQYNLLGDRTRC